MSETKLSLIVKSNGEIELENMGTNPIIALQILIEAIPNLACGNTALEKAMFSMAKQYCEMRHDAIDPLDTTEAQTQDVIMLSLMALEEMM